MAPNNAKKNGWSKRKHCENWPFRELFSPNAFVKIHFNGPIARYSGAILDGYRYWLTWRDKHKILMADRELPFVSGRARRLFPRVHFHFWPQRRRYTCILFLSCELPRSRSRQNSRARQRTDPLRPVNLKLEVAWPRTWSACAADSCWWIY